MSFRWVPFFIGDPDGWVSAHTIPIQLAVQTKEFSRIRMESTAMGWHRCPRYPLDSCLELERFHESLVHDREYDEADEEILVEKDTSSLTTEI
jgi:hypothetical protein